MGKSNDRPTQVLIEEEMRESYLTFAMSVIVSRALPDVRDGLKPVQRRILVAVNELNLGPRSKHRKCGKIVGDTHGNYHPHGEGAIYEALVRMGQPFNFRYPLVDSQGNFGSLDGDPPAAQRYTAARLSDVGAEILQDLELSTVDFVDNYEGTRQEPVVLPGRFPNLLANGASGIAVGMATSIPPHNVRELCDVLIKYIDNPDLSVADIMEILPGPDFPTGGVIRGRQGIVDGYTTGRGTITLRARARVEETDKGGRQRVVITEIPYHVNRETVVQKIADAVQSGVVQDVADIRNESDKGGTRISIELKRGADPNVVLNQLYERTPLQGTVSIMLIVIANGRPETLGISALLGHYIEYRVDVIRRRTAHLLEKAEDRAHVLEGLRIALLNLDEVIKIIRSSKEAAEARERLMETFSLSERQADAILAMRLQSLVGLEQIKIEQEYKDLEEKIQDYRRILADRDLVLDIIREDLYEIREKYGDERRTEIAGAVEEMAKADLIPEEDVVVTISHSGYVKRLPVEQFRSQGRGGKGVIGTDLKAEDLAGHVFVSSTHDFIMLFTNRGLVYWLRVFEIPEMSRTSKGRALVNIVSLTKDEHVTGLVPVKEFEQDYFLFMATAKGIVKKTTLDAFGRRGSGGIIAINLEGDDRLVGVLRTDGKQEVVLATRKGKAIRFKESDVRAMGRNAQGVRGIKLGAEDGVVDMALVRESETLLTICANGYGKRTEFSGYPIRHRGGQGVIDIKTTERNGDVVAACSVSKGDEIMIMSRGGMMVRMPAVSVSCIGRNTQGVRVVRVAKQDVVTDVAKVLLGEGEEAGAAAPKPVPQAEAVEPPPAQEPEAEEPQAEEPAAEPPKAKLPKAGAPKAKKPKAAAPKAKAAKAKAPKATAKKKPAKKAAKPAKRAAKRTAKGKGRPKK